MSATFSASQPSPAAPGSVSPTAFPADIDASCRPVLLLFMSATGWLLLSSVFGIIATLKFHAPNLLADCPWLTYGRVHPAQLSCFTYGFGVQAGVGVMLWLIAHLGRTRLALGPAVVAAWLIWNLGVTAGVPGILYGESTGFEWLEMPRYASAAIFFAYVLFGLAGMVTLRGRSDRSLYISQWFMLAAFFWFAWIFSTANYLLVGRPVRGALQAGIDWWYANNLKTVWFGFTGLAAIFYFIPKVAKRPLQSHYTGVLVFLTLALFGSWGGIPAGVPLPAWMPAMSGMASLLTVVPILAVGFMIYGTLAGGTSMMRESRPFKFFIFGVIAYVLAGLAGAAASLWKVGEITTFTWFVPAQTQLLLYGFFAMTMFGSIYYIVPRLTLAEFPKPGFICLHFWTAVLGILFYAVPLAIGGIRQGFMLNDPSQPFMAVMLNSLLFLRISTLGDVLMALGHLILCANFVGLLVGVARSSAISAWAANVKVAEVVS